MSTGRILMLVLGAAVAAMFGCNRILDDALNPKYCAAHPADIDCIRADDAQAGCTANTQCSAPTPVCATEQKMCVQCTATDHQACTGSTPVCGAADTCVQCTSANPAACMAITPVCGADDTCRACTAHAECSSAACLPNGACGDDTNVAYVAPAPVGSDNAMCTKAAPCVSVSKALQTTRRYVKFSGTTDTGSTVSINDQDVTLLADPNAQLTSTKNGLLLEIRGSSHVAIYDLEITGASGPAGIGISLPAGGTGGLELHRAKVTNNTAGGIVASGGTLTVSESTISGNNGGGIQMNGDAVVTLTNNFVHHNGNDTTASFGAFSLRPMAGSKVEFNTIVDNRANLGAASAGGIFCDVTGFVADNNIIFRNTGGQATTQQTFGTCSYGRSFVMAAPAADNTPQFVHPNTLPFDYHLTAETPITIRDAAGTCSDIDFDGDMRPIGPACDLGADEYRP